MERETPISPLQVSTETSAAVSWTETPMERQEAMRVCLQSKRKNVFSNLYNVQAYCAYLAHLVYSLLETSCMQLLEFLNLII